MGSGRGSPSLDHEFIDEFVTGTRPKSGIAPTNYTYLFVK
jgi:hypothetical protein